MKRILVLLTMWLAAVAAVQAGPVPGKSITTMLSDANAKALPTAAQVTVTEFHHPGFNHYFITAYADEAAHLAAGGLPPWVPTGHTFKVWGGPDQGITNVCRFFSETFAPRSSHFYSNNPVECPGLSAGGVWQLESPAAFYMMPTATGSCPSGTMPLYRLYNDGKSGAPNHRYTIHTSVRATMIAAGWLPDWPQLMEYQPAATFTGSEKVTCTLAPGATCVPPSGGTVSLTDGAVSPMAVPETSRSSTPTHSSLPTALVVMIRTCTCARSLASAGKVTSTGVTSVARLGPVVASATKADGTLVKSPVAPTR